MACVQQQKRANKANSVISNLTAGWYGLLICPLEFFISTTQWIHSAVYDPPPPPPPPAHTHSKTQAMHLTTQRDRGSIIENTHTNMNSDVTRPRLLSYVAANEQLEVEEPWGTFWGSSWLPLWRNLSVQKDSSRNLCGFFKFNYLLFIIVIIILIVVVHCITWGTILSYSWSIKREFKLGYQ